MRPTKINKHPQSIRSARIIQPTLIMSVVRSSELRNRKNKTEESSRTMEFAGYHYPTSQLQMLDRSPTATPVHTRSGSPTRGKAMPHTVQEAEDFIGKLNDLMGPNISSEPSATEKPIGSIEPTAVSELDEKLVLKSVSATDGSATVSISTKIKYLVIYFAFNLGLTLFNKAVMIAVCVYVLFCLFLDFIWENFGGSRAFVLRVVVC